MFWFSVHDYRVHKYNKMHYPSKLIKDNNNNNIEVTINALAPKTLTLFSNLNFLHYPYTKYMVQIQHRGQVHYFKPAPNTLTSSETFRSDSAS